MKIQCLLGALGILLINAIGCFQEAVRPEQEIVDNSIGGANSYPPPIVSNSASSGSASQDAWSCGTEWILLKKPDGTFFYVEIYKDCDPLADIYKGCPSPLDN